MQLTLVNNSKKRCPKKFIDSWMVALAKKLKLKSKTELTLVFLDAKPARIINFEFRGRDYATDILSFESSVGDLSSELGELVLCPSVLEKQAKEHEHSYNAELGYMLIHGVLHLLGFDHESRSPEGRKQAEEMYALQDQLFDSLATKFNL